VNSARRWSWVLRNTAANLWRGRFAAVATVASTTLTVVLATGALLLGMQLSRLEDHWTGNVDVTVYLCTRMSVAANCEGAAGADDIATIRGNLATIPGISQVSFEDRDAAARAFAERFENTGIPEMIGPDALPESFRVKIDRNANRGDVIGAVTAALQETPGVETVQDQRKVLSGFFTIARRVRTGALLLAIVQAVTSTAFLAHLVRASVTRRSREIRVMNLVGTPSATIRAPFLLESAALSLTAATIASATIVGVLSVARNAVGTGTEAPILLDTATVATVCAATGPTIIVLGWIVARSALRKALPREI
jgi:cell division transport system permease protein